MKLDLHACRNPGVWATPGQQNLTRPHHHHNISMRAAAVVAQVQAALWVLGAAVVAFYGNGKDDLVTLVLTEPRLNRLAINLAYLSLSINVLLFVYAYGWLEAVRGVDNALRRVKWIAPAGGASFAVVVVSLIVGLWPMFSILSVPIVIVETLGVIMALHFAPTFGFLRVKRPHQD